GHAQSQHETVLSRSDVEQTMEFEAKRVGLVGKLIALGVRYEFVPDIQGIFVELPPLGLGKFGERCAENRFFLRSCREIRGRIAGAGRDLSAGGDADERRLSSERREESL